MIIIVFFFNYKWNRDVFNVQADTKIHLQRSVYIFKIQKYKAAWFLGPQVTYLFITWYSQSIVTITINFVCANNRRRSAVWQKEKSRIRQWVRYYRHHKEKGFMRISWQQEESILLGPIRLCPLRWCGYRLRWGRPWWPPWKNCKAFSSW